MSKSAKAEKSNLTRYQRFVTERWNRAQIKNAPYNPRTIDAYARKKLEGNLKRIGLLGPITVNRSTGHIVGGHQRLACLDALEERGDYDLDVAVVELSEKVEREQNVFMNNPSAMGSWDTSALAALMKDGFDVDASGFDRVDLEIMFADDPEVLGMFNHEAAPEAVKSTVNDLEELAGIKRRRAEFTEKFNERNNSEIYAVVVFSTNAERDTFVRGLGRAAGERYLDGRMVAMKLGIELK